MVSNLNAMPSDMIVSEHKIDVVVDKIEPKPVLEDKLAGMFARGVVHGKLVVAPGKELHKLVQVVDMQEHKPEPVRRLELVPDTQEHTLVLTLRSVPRRRVPRPQPVQVHTRVLVHKQELVHIQELAHKRVLVHKLGQVEDKRVGNDVLVEHTVRQAAHKLADISGHNDWPSTWKTNRIWACNNYRTILHQQCCYWKKQS
jgi:hypothetical protein